jgi:predicted DNA-binding protein (MmcQ/YjbR family)
VFVFLGPDERTGPPLMTVKLVESHGHALALAGAEPTGYGLGKSGWVNVPLHAEGATLDLLRDLVEESYRIVAPKRLSAELDRATARRAG